MFPVHFNSLKFEIFAFLILHVSNIDETGQNTPIKPHIISSDLGNLCSQISEANRLCSSVHSSQQEVSRANAILSRFLNSAVDDITRIVSATERAVGCSAKGISSVLTEQQAVNNRLKSALEEVLSQPQPLKVNEIASQMPSRIEPQLEESGHNVAHENASEERNPGEESAEDENGAVYKRQRQESESAQHVYIGRQESQRDSSASSARNEQAHRLACVTADRVPKNAFQAIAGNGHSNRSAVKRGSCSLQCVICGEERRHQVGVMKNLVMEMSQLHSDIVESINEIKMHFDQKTHAARLVKDLFSEMSQLQSALVRSATEIIHQVEAKTRAVPKSVSNPPEELQVRIKRVESQALDLELALRAIGQAIRDFSGSSFLFAAAQERRERLCLLDHIEELKMEISSKDARISAIHGESRALMQKLESQTKAEQHDKRKLQDQVAALISERDQMKVEYSSRIGAMHEAVIKLTEDGELMDASFNEEVRRRDAMIEEMKCYLLAEVHAMKAAMLQLAVQNQSVHSDGSQPATPAQVDSGQGPPDRSVDSTPDRADPSRRRTVPAEYTEPLTPRPPPRSSRRSGQPPSEPRQPRAAAASAAASASPLPHFSVMLNELREVLNEAGGAGAEDPSEGSSLVAKVQRAKCRRQNSDASQASPA
jgi:hypothetical protein